MAPIENLDAAASPALLFDTDTIDRNLARMLELVSGDPNRLRPHIKTHKCRDILALQLDLGIKQVKCATVAEAELSALAGVPDVLLAYPLVGPNVARFFDLVAKYPNTSFSTLVDCERAMEAFAESKHGPTNLFLDLDCGMGRTGIVPGDAALGLVRALVAHPSLRFAGVHAYDGHIHDGPLQDRIGQFQSAIAIIDEFVEKLESEGIPVPLVVSGGSPTFALHAAHSAKVSRPWQCSPGTTVLWDAGYGEKYPDLPFDPAAFLLTRVVSHPGPNRICLDLGHKAVAAENPITRRVRFPEMPDAAFVSQSEEHLVLEIENTEPYPVGTALVGIPCHICPTVALHQEALLVRANSLGSDHWPIEARNRRLTV